MRPVTGTHRRTTRPSTLSPGGQASCITRRAGGVSIGEQIAEKEPDTYEWTGYYVEC